MLFIIFIWINIHVVEQYKNVVCAQFIKAQLHALFQVPSVR